MAVTPGAPALNRFWLGLTCLTALLLSTGPVSAETLTYDQDGNSANGITDANGGTWNLTNTNWFKDTLTPNVAWPNTTADIAVFGSGASTGAPASITVGTAGNINLNGIIFNYANAANTGTYTLNAGAQFIFGGTNPTVTVNSNTATINARLTATSFAKDGTGILVINNSQNSLGAVNVNAGVLDIFATLATTDVVVASGARFDTHSGTTWTMNSLTYNGTGNSNMTSLSNTSVSNYTVGAGGLTINAGTITVNAGTNVASNARSTLIINGPLNFGGGTINITTSNTAGNEPAEAKVLLRNNINVTGNATMGNSGLGTETLDLDAATRTVTVATGFTFNLNAVTANGGLTKEGAGTLKLGGAQSNTYTGMTTVTAGILAIGKTGGANAVVGDITVNGGTLDWDVSNQIADTSSLFLNGGTLKFDGFSETLTNLTIAGGNVNDGGGTNGGFVNITGTLSGVSGTSGISLNSGGQWTVGTLNFAAAFNPSGSEIGLNGNSTRLTLFTVGSGGMTINGHAFSIEKAPTANPLNAGSEMAIYGDVTATGSNTFTYGTGNTSGVSNVNLGSGIRTWNIISGTTTINSTVVSLTPGDGAVTPARTVVDGGILKTGAGTMILNADNTYIGKTTVNQGILRLSTNGAFTTGGIRDSYWLQVNSGATFDNATGNTYTHDGTLSGTGSIGGAFRIGDNTGSVLDTGILRPGNTSNAALESAAGDQTGTITFTGALELAAPTGPAVSTVRAELQIIGITGNAASSYSGGSQAAWIAAIGSNHAALVTGLAGNHDQIKVTGALTLNAGGTINVVAPNGYTPAFGDVFNLLDWGSLTAGTTFNVGTNNRTGGSGGGDLNLPDLSAYPGYFWDVSQFLNTGIVVVVPEPGRVMLFLLGLGGVMLRRRRK